MNKVLVITSGGMDSRVLLQQHLSDGDEVRALAVDYGQRHRVELGFARRSARVAGVPFEVADLSSLGAILKGSSQTDSSVPVPKGHYSEDTMKATVVPNRNMILLAVAIGHAISLGFDFVSYAAHAGDHTIYPDCRPEFASAMDAVSQLCDWHPVRLLRPFIQKTKADIVRLGFDFGVPFEETYSCYEGRPIHCGCCGTCIERREAFWLAGVPDPTVYDPTAPSVGDLVVNDWRLPG